MIQRHHGHDDVARRDAEDIGLQHHQGVQEIRPVRIQDALRIAGGSRRVAQSRSGGFREAAPGAGRILIPPEFLEQEMRDGQRHRRRGWRQKNHLGDLPTRAEQGGDQGGECTVGKQQSVPGVAHDVLELFDGHPRIQRVAHRADARRRIPGLEMLGAVHRQRGNAIPGSDAASEQGIRDPQRAAMRSGIRGPVDAAIIAARGDFPAPVPACCVFEEAVDGERPVLHQALHVASPMARSLARIGACRWRP